MPPRSVLGVIAVLFAFYICAGCGSVRPAAPIPTSSGLIIKTMTMPSGAVGTSYSYTLAAQGGLPPYSWSLTAGALPPGLQLEANTGLVAGTPSVAGTESIGFEVQDSGQHSASMTLTINIAAQTPSSPLGINTTTVPAGTIGASYSFALSADGGVPPYSWRLASGALPAGLVLGSTTGTVSGTPTQVGDQSTTIQVEDSAHAVASKSFTFSVNATTPSSPSYRAYYVDFLSGNDSNDGTSEAAPWRTIAKVNSSSFASGDHILFKRGDTWRELLAISSSGAAGNPIVVDAYGSGAAPIISGADLIPPTAWTQCSSCPSKVWQAQVSTQPNIVMFNGTSGTAESSMSGLTAAGDWYWKANVLYVWCATSPGASYTNPGVEAGSRKLVVDLSGLAYVTLQTLQLTGGNGIPTNGVIYAHEQNGAVPHDLVLNNLVVANGAGHGVHLEDCNNCQMQSLSISGMGSDGISLVSLDVTHPVTSGSVVDNTVTTSHHDGIATYGCAIGGSCQGTSEPKGLFISGIKISNNIIHDNGEGIYLQWTNGSTVSANTVYHNTDTTDAAAEGGGVELEASSNNVIQENLIYTNRGDGVELSNDAGAGSTLTGASGNVLQYNALHDNGSGGLFTDAAPTQNNQFLYNLVWNHVNGECFLADGVGHTFYGNVCWNNSTGIDLYTSSATPLTANITIKNNIIAGSITRAVHIESGVSSSTLVFDHNNYDFGSGAEFLLFDTAYSFGEWQSATGLDAHSFVANPGFLSSAPATPSDFVIQATSPNVGAGAALGSSLALGLTPGSAWPGKVSTTSQASAWDIGAFVVP